MILTKLYRLKRKKGAVLFVVIAMMTLLVIMATAAYITARGSYATVINNYDFSQLYLSATSISDMMIGAVTNDTVDPTTNNFAALTSAVKSLDKGKSIKVKSNNINSSWTTAEQILAGTANAPVERGVVDAIQVSITNEDRVDLKGADGKPTGKSMDYYLITTTAYYRDNIITVQDRIAREWGAKTNPNLFNTFFTATGQQLNGGSAEKDNTRCVVIKTHSISDDAYFENPFTVFKDGNSNVFLGGITTAGSVFLDKFTCGADGKGIPDPTGSEPSDWNADSSAKVSGSRNDWYIGDNLYIGQNAGNLNLGNNNLYVDGDLVIANCSTITAKNVYVTGNVIYLKDDFSVNGNLYVGGTVLGSLVPEKVPDDAPKGTELTDDQKRRNATKEKVINDFNAINSACKSALTEAGEKNPGDLMHNEKIKDTTNNSGATCKVSDSSKEFIINGTADIQGKTENLDSGPWTAADTKVPFEFQETTGTDPNRQYETFVNYKDYNAFSAVDNKTETTVFANYTASAETMKRVLTVDFSMLTATTEVINGNKETVYVGGFNYHDPSETDPTKYVTSYGLGDANVKLYDNGKASNIVQLPYTTDGKGYVLDMRSSSSPGNVNLSNFGFECQIGINKDGKESDITVQKNPDGTIKQGNCFPIVLMANYDDGTSNPKDSRNYNAFSWTGSGSGCSNGVKVKIMGKSDVFFEVGNYDSTGKYVPYTAGAGINTAVYKQTTKVMVGTKAQLEYDYKNPDNLAESKKLPTQNKAVLQQLLKKDGMGNVIDGDVISGYDNKIMLISNKNGGIAIDTCGTDTNFFGYVYAPNGQYSNWKGGAGAAPIFGGMIVSNYTINLADFVYAEPNPTLIDYLNSALPKKSPKDGSGDIWYVSNPDKQVGSNFLG